MLTLLRWTIRVFLGLVALAALALVVLYYFTARSIPDYSASYEIAALGAPVEIVRDNANVPHIFGDTDEDVFFGLGFAHAQDRLWQMTMLRRTAQGRLSEVFGARSLRTDELMRRLDLHGLAVRSVSAQDARTRAALEAYARGVNEWVRIVNAQARGRGAPEFFLFPSEIAYWQPADSIALIKLMGLQMSSHLQNEVLRARLSLLLEDDARVRDLMPDAPDAGLADLPDYAALFPGGLPEHMRSAQAAAQQPAAPFSPFAPRQLAAASNAWAAAPSRSASGGTLLANDPHLGFSAPSLWYLARIELEGGGVIGGTIPGIPAVLSGRSDALGWGLTSSYMDDQDLFIEQLNPANPEEYRAPGGWAGFETRRSIIRVRGADPVTITLRWTENGPVLPGHHFDIGTITPPGHVTSLGWTLLDPADTSMTAAMRLMRAQSVSEAIVASAHHVAPAQNLMLADRDRIAMQMIGAMPRRDAAHQTEGRMPAPGWIAQNRWQGRLPHSANPRFETPSSGILGNTNNKPLSRPFPLHVSHDWGDTQRIQRWLRLMGDREVHTRDSFIEAQLDTVSPSARALLPLIGADLWFTGEAAPEGTPERLRQRALQLLADWNGEMNEHLPEPLIYAAWLRHLQDRLVRDELGPLSAAFTHVEPLFIERVYRDIDGASEWCNVVQSSVRETCTDMARLALDDALIWLSERFGPNPDSWRWGDAHQAVHAHPTLGEMRVLRYFVNITQSTSGGDHTLMRGMTAGTGPEPYQNVHGAGYRGVYDFADPDSSVFIIATGQSGHPLSRHYDDLGERWRRGEYIPMSLDPGLARAGAVGITRLEPPQ
ncbi:penicillin acylase family protein [Alkalilacustris brevis]|uniref:penicillin acylase family protein n=1 Tax=Alkalilacustris brevis TaxID=2026338 RepID=UPI000E0D34DB|nr:penicillin acylase family protein [Alkalilacustris brevis]